MLLRIACGAERREKFSILAETNSCDYFSLQVLPFSEQQHSACVVGGDSQTFPSHMSFPLHLAPWFVYIFVQSLLSKYIWINNIFLCSNSCVRVIGALYLAQDKNVKNTYILRMAALFWDERRVAVPVLRLSKFYRPCGLWLRSKI